MRNSGIRGKLGTIPTNTSANGIWTLREQHIYRISDIWIKDQTVTDGLTLSLDAGNASSYPGNGNIWYDISGNNRNATLINSPTWSSSGNGMFTFNGTNQAVDTGYDVSWNNLNAVSFTFVVKPNSTTNSGSIAGKKFADWEWAFFQSGTSLSMVYWNTGGGHTNGMDFTVTNFFPDTNFVVFQYVWNGSISYVYRNGSLVFQHTATNPSDNQNRTNQMMLAGNIYQWGDVYWNGSISLVHTYNRALTSSEISQNFNAVRSRYSL